jgi:hypothetical protein
VKERPDEPASTIGRYDRCIKAPWSTYATTSNSGKVGGPAILTTDFEIEASKQDAIVSVDYAEI